MKKTSLVAMCMAAACALAGCGKSADSSVADDTSSEITTSSPDASSDTTVSTESTDTTSSDTSVVTDSSSESTVTSEDSNSQVADSYGEFDGNSFTSDYFGCSFSYPDDWKVTPSVTSKGDNDLLSLLCDADKLDLTISSKLEACTYTNEVEVDSLIESLEQTYTNIVAQGSEDDPMGIKNLAFSESEAKTLGSLNGKAFTITYVQRNMNYYVYTVVYRRDDTQKDFLIATFTYNDETLTSQLDFI